MQIADGASEVGCVGDPHKNHGLAAFLDKFLQVGGSRASIPLGFSIYQSLPVRHSASFW